MLSDLPSSFSFSTLDVMDEDRSIWQSTLEQFQQAILCGDSIIGGVAVSCVSAALAASVLQMVLKVVSQKHDFEESGGFMAAAQTISEGLAAAADEDRAAYAAYVSSCRLPKGTEERKRAITAALLQATETPLAAARTAAEGMDLCSRLAPLIQGAIAADVTAAAALFKGAAAAILASVQANLRSLAGHPEHARLAAEARRISSRL